MLNQKLFCRVSLSFTVRFWLLPRFMFRKKINAEFVFYTHYIHKLNVKLLQVRSSADRKYQCIKDHNSETVRIVLINWFTCWPFPTKITSLECCCSCREFSQLFCLDVNSSSVSGKCQQPFLFVWFLLLNSSLVALHSSNWCLPELSGFFCLVFFNLAYWIHLMNCSVGLSKVSHSRAC